MPWYARACILSDCYWDEALVGLRLGHTLPKLAQHDPEAQSRARASRGSAQRLLLLLDKLEAGFAKRVKGSPGCNIFS